jgi:hypothetical protein
MTLPKEWHELAQREAQETTDIEKFSNQGDYNKALNAAEYDYLQGAKAYKQAVEKELNRRIEMCKIKVNTEPDARGSYLQQASYYEQLLTELVSLKPTSNRMKTAEEVLDENFKHKGVSNIISKQGLVYKGTIKAMETYATQQKTDLTTQLAKANSDKERLGELLKEAAPILKSYGMIGRSGHIEQTLQDCGITL